MSTAALGKRSSIAFATLAFLAGAMVLAAAIDCNAGDSATPGAPPATTKATPPPAATGATPEPTPEPTPELTPAAAGSSSLGVDEAFLARCLRAAEHSEANGGRTMLVMHRGEIVFERYKGGASASSAFELASGTKSFVGILAMLAAEDGLLTLDERASDTLTEWKDDPTKHDITIRQILTLTSGIGSGTIGRPPTFADAVALRLRRQPGVGFIYGPAPFQVFGEILRRKLVARDEEPGSPAGAGPRDEARGSTDSDASMRAGGARSDGPVGGTREGRGPPPRSGEGVQAYAKRRLFDPLGISIASWRVGRDGQPHLPSGIALTARDWAKFGEFVRRGGMVGDTQLLPAERIAECMRGTSINPHYGLTWWLAWLDGQGLNPEESLQGGRPRKGEAQAPDIWMAAGLGKQRLYIIPPRELVIVRQAPLVRGRGFDDQVFLSTLLELGQSVQTPPAAPRRPGERPLRERLRSVVGAGRQAR